MPGRSMTEGELFPAALREATTDEVRVVLPVSAGAELEHLAGWPRRC